MIQRFCPARLAWGGQNAPGASWIYSHVKPVSLKKFHHSSSLKRGADMAEGFPQRFEGQGCGFAQVRLGQVRLGEGTRTRRCGL
jgi:hypothetical protein